MSRYPRRQRTMAFLDTPFVCNMNVLNARHLKHYKEITFKLNQERQSVKGLNDGYDFRFKAKSQLIRDAAEFIVYERLRCPFLTLNWRLNRIQTGYGCACEDREEIKKFILYEFKIEE